MRKDEKKLPRAGRIFSLALAAVTAALSAYLLFLCFADAYDRTLMFINATDTGRLLCPLCALTFACAVVCIVYRYREGAGGSAVLAALPHAVIVLSLTVEVLTVTNFFNHAMEFLTSDISKVLLTVYATLSFLLSAELAGRRQGGGRVG